MKKYKLFLHKLKKMKSLHEKTKLLHEIIDLKIDFGYIDLSDRIEEITVLSNTERFEDFKTVILSLEQTVNQLNLVEIEKKRLLENHVSCLKKLCNINC